MKITTTRFDRKNSLLFATQRFYNCLLATKYVTRKVAYLSKEIASFFLEKKSFVVT